jgi:F5/8 type C domain
VHNPELAFDGNMISTWLSQTDGVGQWITAYFKTPTTITSVAICNGNCSNKMRYEVANRIQTLRMTFSDGTSQVITFEQKPVLQRFELPRPIVAEWVKFEILSIWPGTKFFHTPISEIMFNRAVSDIAPVPSRQPESLRGRGNAPKLDHP